MEEYLQIDKVGEGEKLTLRLAGRLDTVSAPSLEKAVKEIIAKELDGLEKLVIDMEQTQYVSSAGLRVLLFAAKGVKRADGRTRMRIINVNESVRKVFTITGFDKILTISGEEDEEI